MINDELLDLINTVAEENDQTVDSGYTYEPIPAGKFPARFVEYIDLGKQPQRPYQGKEKEPVNEIQIAFDLLSKKTMEEIEVNGVKKMVCKRVVLTLAEHTSSKSKYRKLLDRMANGRKDIKHMAKMLGEAFLIEVKHNEVEKDGKKTTYANVYDNGSWLISPPVVDITDPETGEIEAKLITVPAPMSALRFFSFSRPTQSTWDSLFVDGEYETKDQAGTVTKHSKNKLQNKIKAATNFKCSAVESLVAGIRDEDLTEASTDSFAQLEDDLDELVVQDPPKKAAAKKVEPKKTESTAKAATTAAASNLEALGLDM